MLSSSRATHLPARAETGPAARLRVHPTHRARTLHNYFNYCLLDTSPRLSALTYAALVASDRVFIPCQLEFYGCTGLTNLLDAYARVSEHFNPQLRVGGLFFIEYSPKYQWRRHHEIVELIGERYVAEQLVLDTTIRENISLVEAQIQQESSC